MKDGSGREVPEGKSIGVLTCPRCLDEIAFVIYNEEDEILAAIRFNPEDTFRLCLNILEVLDHLEQKYSVVQ
jgi:hypothetical protein